VGPVGNDKGKMVYVRILSMKVYKIPSVFFSIVVSFFDLSTSVGSGLNGCVDSFPVVCKYIAYISSHKPVPINPYHAKYLKWTYPFFNLDKTIHHF
jgi:hypothetical protein